MANNEQIAVRPAVLRWARETAGMTIVDTAERLRVPADDVLAWETDVTSLGLTELRKIAAVYRRPLSALLRVEPPAAAEFPTDFRTIGGRPPAMSGAVIAALRRARRIQRAIGSLPVEFRPVLQMGRASLDDVPETVAATERARLAVSVSMQLAAPSSNAAFNLWRARIQEAGVIVLVERMDRDDCRGFALWDSGQPPVVVVCNSESDEAKTFTALHEYGHLLLRSSAACLEIESGEGALAATEAWCNRFASAVLASKDVINAVLGRLGLSTPVEALHEVTEIARRLRVSRHVVALRLEALGLAPRGLYGALRGQLASDGGRPPLREDADIRIPAPQRVASELGFLPALAVLASVESGEAGPGDAATLLGVRAQQLGALGAVARRLQSQYARG